MKRSLWFCVAALALVGCNRTPFEGEFRNASNSLEETRKKAVALGLPIDPDTFDPIDVPQDQNAAVPYRDALTQWKAIRNQRHEWGLAADNVARQIATSADVAVYSRAKPAFQPIVDSLYVASRLERMDRNLNYGKLNYESDRDNDGLYSTTQLIGAAASEAARAGDPEAMKEALKVLLSMARHAGDEPRLAGVLNQVSLTRNYVRTALGCLVLLKGSSDGARAVLETRASRPVFNFKEALRCEIAANIGLMRALGTQPTKDSKILDANFVAELIGAVPDPETDKQLGVVDTQSLDLARRALEARLLETWIKVYPMLEGSPADMCVAMEKVQKDGSPKDDPTYAVIRSAYAEVSGLADAVMGAEAAMTALDLACMRLQGVAFGVSEESTMRQHALRFMPTERGFLFRRSLDKTSKPILEYRPLAD